MQTPTLNLRYGLPAGAFTLSVALDRRPVERAG